MSNRQPVDGLVTPGEEREREKKKLLISVVLLEQTVVA